MTALTEYPARAEEFGTRARVLPLLRCTFALGTQIVAALRLRFRLRKSTRRVQARPIKVCVKSYNTSPVSVLSRKHAEKICTAESTKFFAPLTTMSR